MGNPEEMAGEAAIRKFGSRIASRIDELILDVKAVAAAPDRAAAETRARLVTLQLATLASGIRRFCLCETEEASGSPGVAKPLEEASSDG